MIQLYPSTCTASTVSVGYPIKSTHRVDPIGAWIGETIIPIYWIGCFLGIRTGAAGISVVHSSTTQEPFLVGLDAFVVLLLALQQLGH